MEYIFSHIDRFSKLWYSKKNISERKGAEDESEKEHCAVFASHFGFYSEFVCLDWLQLVVQNGKRNGEYDIGH